MEQNRQLRFLIPPFVFLVSLAWGAATDRKLFGFLTDLHKSIPIDGIDTIIGVVAAGGVAVIAVGFLISSISVFFLRILFRVFWRQDYEAHLPPDALERVGQAIDFKAKLDKRHMLYAVATYDHAVLPHSLHDWIARRWNTFIVSSNCCVALLLSFLFGIALGVNGEWLWILPSVFLIVVLAINANKSRQQTMEMLAFLSSCSLINEKSEGGESQQQLGD